MLLAAAQVRGQLRVRFIEAEHGRGGGGGAPPLRGWASVATRGGEDLLVPLGEPLDRADGDAPAAAAAAAAADAEVEEAAAASEGLAAARIRTELATMQAIARSNQ